MMYKVRGKELTETEYYYGVKSSGQWRYRTYLEALQTKILLAKAVIALEQSYDLVQRDCKRIDKCLGAIQFNTKLMKE